MLLSSLLLLLPAASAVSLPHLNLPLPPRRAHIARQNNDVPSAVAAALSSAPTWGVSAKTYITTGQSVDLLPVTPNLAINSSAYTSLSRSLPTVLSHAVEASKHSWEIGSLIQSLLECYLPKLAAFDFDRTAFDGDIPWAALWITEAALTNYDWTGSPGTTNPSDVVNLGAYLHWSSTPTPLVARPLIDGAGSLGDPASLGTAVWVLAHFALRSDVRQGLRSGLSSAQLAWALGNQLEYLRQGQTDAKGTISMREGSFQLWADMGSMIPPFPAFIGADTSRDELLEFGLDQWILESEALIDANTNLFYHIIDMDQYFWSTGNGWMLHGGARVLASVEQAGQSTALKAKVDQVKNTMNRVFTAVFAQLNGENVVPNYIFHWNTDAAHSGSETCGTAVIVAAYYRFIELAPELASSANTAAAARAFDGVNAKIGGDGWLTDVVNPMGPWIVDGAQSPEGQSFLGMMWAARTKAGI